VIDKEVEMKQGRMILSVIVSLLLLSSLAAANGLNLNNLGSRALAMGGAFVGLADDFSTIYWNPAGIAQFDRQYFGLYGTDLIPSGTYSLDLPVPGVGTLPVDAETQRKHYLAGLAAFYYPISENLVAGLGVYIPAGLGAKWDGADLTALTFGTAYEWRSRIGMVTFSPALAYKINEQVSVGATININYGVFEIETHAGDSELGVDIGQYTEDMSGWGVGATLGILVKPNEMFSFGATVRTESKISFNGDTSISKLNVLGQIPGTPIFGASIPTTTEIERDVTWPWWIAGGVAVRPTPNLILTADLQYTAWESKIKILESKFTDSFWQMLVDADRPLFFDNALQIRFGAEYTIDNIALRGGYYWDPSPAPDRTMNILLPNYDFHVFTAGLGYNVNGLQVDVAFEYLMGKERDVPLLKTLTDPDWETAMPGTFKMNISVPNVSFSYRF
jgi:long-chain fatty acid transport protein